MQKPCAIEPLSSEKTLTKGVFSRERGTGKEKCSLTQMRDLALDSLSSPLVRERTIYLAPRGSLRPATEGPWQMFSPMV